MTYIALIDHRGTQRRRFEASLHGCTLEGDEVKAAMGARGPMNASHAHLLRMKARRMRERR